MKTFFFYFLHGCILHIAYIHTYIHASIHASWDYLHADVSFSVGHRQEEEGSWCGVCGMVM